MIALTSREGNWLKTFSGGDEDYIFHSQFGFIPKSQLAGRLARRERFALHAHENDIQCQFRLSQSADGKIRASNLVGCEAATNGSGLNLKSNFGEFRLVPVDEATVIPPGIELDTDGKIWKYALLVLLFVSATFMLTPRMKTEVAPQVILEPVRITMLPEVKKQKAVTVPSETSDLANKLKVQDKETKRAIQQNLGFLGLLGKKNLTKALGGMPSTLKEASAGAGAGGKEGSGGEFLVGLGQGVHRATVGNTGVAGLGGIGTKGAGGGAGGYGNSMVGSGEGKSLSKVALSNELTLDGGLDRTVIQATIAKYLSQVRACYEDQLQKNPGLSGQVTMAFSINGAGAVTESNVARSTLGNPVTENCISARMKTWNFPKPVGGVTVKVNYPFLLRPAGA